MKLRCLLTVQVVGDLVLTCSCHSVQVMRHRRRALVTGTSGGVLTAEGEYMEPGIRLDIPGPGGITSVDTDGRIVLIGEPRFRSFNMMTSWKIVIIGTSTSLLTWDLCQRAFISNIRTGVA